MLRPLRDYQENAKGRLDQALSSGESKIMIQGPCGFGKTLMAAHIISDLLAQGKRVCFVAPRLTLIDQAVEAFKNEGFEAHIGVIQGNHPLTDYDQLLQVASLQTLVRRKLPEIDAFIVDEAHMSSDAFIRLVNKYQDTPFIGLSATPWRAGLGKTYKKLIIAETTAGLIERGYLVPFKTFAPAPPIDLSGVSVLGTGDYNQSQLSDAVNKTELVGDIIRHWQALGENRSTICFCVDRAHAKHVQERFSEAGIPAAYVDCYTPDLERREIIEDFRNGVIRVICNVGVLTTGFDAPEASCMIDAAPTRSLILHVQKTGRVLRSASGKSNAIILDHAGNALSLGVVTDIHRDYMCDGSAESRARRKATEKKELKPRLCEECKTVVARHLDKCPECGTSFNKFTQIINREGLLRAIDDCGSEHPEDVRTKRINLSVKAAFYGELKFLGEQRGYKSGWAANQYKQRFGVWPNHPDIRDSIMRRPTLDTLNWVRSRQIAWSKSRVVSGKSRPARF